MKIKLLSGLIAAALVGAALSTLAPASAGGAGAPAATPPADAQTTRVVNAANAFLATLTAAQRQAVLFAWTDDTQRRNWSNFPQGGAGVNRKGVRWGEMTPAQRAALMTLLGTVLSTDGVNMVKGQMLADDLIRATDQGQGPAAANQAGTAGTGTAQATSTGATATQTTSATPSTGSGQATTGAAGTAPAPSGAQGGGPPAGGPQGGARPAVSFGSDYSFVSFVGSPSATSPWMMQFGGHHLAINATVVGPNITLSPSLTGGEPIKVSFNNQTYVLVPNVPVEAQAAYSLLQTLSAAQRARAVISTTRTDLVLGPGQDGKTLQPEGLPGSAMTAAQKTQFLTLIKDRLGILNANDLAAKMAAITRDIDQTYFAWSGPTTSAGSAYHRVTGPTVIIEFSPQANDGDPSDHLHNMYRDPTNEYGAGLTSLK